MATIVAHAVLLHGINQDGDQLVSWLFAQQQSSKNRPLHGNTELAPYWHLIPIPCLCWPGKFTANGIVAPSGEPEPPEDPLRNLTGLEDALALMEAAISQNTHLAQLLLYRDLKPGMALPLAPSPQPHGPGQQLQAEASGTQLLPQGSVRPDLASSFMSKESSMAMDAASRRTSVASGLAYNNGFVPSLRGSSASNGGGGGVLESISRAGSCSIASMHSLRSMVGVSCVYAVLW